MDLYDLFSIIIVPITLISFCIDYLSDKDIIQNEVKIGFFSFLHHLICSIQGSVLINICLSNNLLILVLTYLITIICQICWILNKDYCCVTRFVNILINPSKKYRKWRSGITMYLKHYIRGDDWAYSDFTNYRNNKLVLLGNIVIIIWCIKIIIINYLKNN